MTTKPQRHLKDLMEGFSTAMLITHLNDYSVHARPMAIAHSDDDGSLYFATSVDSAKLREIEAEPNVALTMQSSSVFISVLGTAHASTDRALIDRIWSEEMQVWFPDGKDDPMLVILKVVPNKAEYWDNSGVKGLGFAVSALKAYITGQKLDANDSGQNAKVTL
jgi:general stress protein 26